MVKREIKRIINNYLITLKKNNINYEKVFLFGSFAKEKSSVNSYIDLAIIINEVDDRFKLQLLLMKLRRNIDLRIEPHPIAKDEFTENNPFASEIMRYGIEVGLT